MNIGFLVLLGIMFGALCGINTDGTWDYQHMLILGILPLLIIYMKIITHSKDYIPNTGEEDCIDNQLAHKSIRTLIIISLIISIVFGFMDNDVIFNFIYTINTLVVFSLINIIGIRRSLLQSKIKR